MRTDIQDSILLLRCCCVFYRISAMTPYCAKWLFMGRALRSLVLAQECAASQRADSTVSTSSPSNHLPGSRTVECGLRRQRTTASQHHGDLTPPSSRSMYIRNLILSPAIAGQCS